MPEYVYRAITKEGVIVRNKVDSPSKQTLIKRLKAGELLPIDIVQVGYGLGKKKVTKKRRNVTDIDEIMKTANSSTIIQGRGNKPSLGWNTKNNNKGYNDIYSKLLLIEEGRL